VHCRSYQLVMTCLVCGHEVALCSSFQTMCELDLHHIALGCTTILLSLSVLGMCIASSLTRLTWRHSARKCGAKCRFETATVFLNKVQRLHVGVQYEVELQRQRKHHYSTPTAGCLNSSRRYKSTSCRALLNTDVQVSENLNRAWI